MKSLEKWRKRLGEQENLKDLQKQLETLLIPKDPEDEKNVLLEIRAGTGGDEASIFAGDLLKMYSQYAESRMENRNCQCP